MIRHLASLLALLGRVSTTTSTTPLNPGNFLQKRTAGSIEPRQRAANRKAEKQGSNDAFTVATDTNIRDLHEGVTDRQLPNPGFLRTSASASTLQSRLHRQKELQVIITRAPRASPARNTLQRARQCPHRLVSKTGPGTNLQSDGLGELQRPQH
ncbi:hypothetical protein GGI35DRAFT_67642 [Trichoderma velutinum]